MNATTVAALVALGRLATTGACAGTAEAPPPLPPDVGASHPPGEPTAAGPDVASTSPDAGSAPAQGEPPPQAADAGASTGASGDAGADAAAAAGPPAQVEIADVSFEGGDVPTLKKALEKVLPQLGKCVGERGGLSGASGKLRVQMLVRARERAEGVEVSDAKGITPEAASCIRLALKDKWVGAPSAEFVEAKLVLSFKPGKEAR